jgi:ATP phosphoribosyltransferase
VEIEHIADITSRLIVNRTALKLRPDEMNGWVNSFAEAVKTRSKG